MIFLHFFTFLRYFFTTQFKILTHNSGTQYVRFTLIYKTLLVSSILTV